MPSSPWNCTVSLPRSSCSLRMRIWRNESSSKCGGLLTQIRKPLWEYPSTRLAWMRARKYTLLLSKSINRGSCSSRESEPSKSLELWRRNALMSLRCFSEKRAKGSHSRGRASGLLGLRLVQVPPLNPRANSEAGAPASPSPDTGSCLLAFEISLLAPCCRHSHITKNASTRGKMRSAAGGRGAGRRINKASVSWSSSVGGAALWDWPALDDCAAGEVAEAARAGAEERASWASIAVMHADSSSQKGFSCLCKSSTTTPRAG
mmetsp:Transcript_23928/g.45470  ORF Transcript_23928/g.45470 Transcript_23928/m.45470 type:complete len:262 (+) Transcript_23928:1266-2051(+)